MAHGAGKDAVGTRVVMDEGIKVLATLLDVALVGLEDADEIDKKQVIGQGLEKGR